jgi:hypothetical protein
MIKRERLNRVFYIKSKSLSAKNRFICLSPEEGSSKGKIMICIAANIPKITIPTLALFISSACISYIT